MAFVNIPSQVSVGAPYTLKYFVVLFLSSKCGKRMNDQQHFLSNVPIQHLDHLINQHI